MPGWKGGVTFGCGTPRGAGLTGFHTTGSLGVFSGVLYRGDSRAPTGWLGFGGLFSSGFQLHAAGITVAGRMTSATAQVHCDHGTTRGVVSASKDVKIGAYWAISGARHAGATHGWVYAAYIEDEKAAADAVWNLQGEQGRDAAAIQAEIMLKEIPGTRIFAARKAMKVGGDGVGVISLVGPVVYNTGYAGTDFRTIGAAAGDADWALFTNAADPTSCQ